MPRAISSSSAQNVPSKSSASAPARRVSSAASRSPHPGTNAQALPLASSRIMNPTVCPSSSHVRESRRAGRHRKRLHRKAARGPVTVAKGHGGVQGEIGHGNLAEGSGHRQQARIAIEYRLDGSRRVNRQVSGLAQQDDAEGVVDLCVGDQDAFDRHMPNCRRGVVGPHPTQLVADIGRRIQEKPPAPVAADGCG